MTTNITNLNEKLITSVYTEEQTYTYEKLTARVKRVKNDYYGNPIYHITLISDYENITHCLRGKGGRVYTKHGYDSFLSIQSYNIGDTIIRMLREGILHQ